MLKKIYEELVLIRKELQVIRSDLESEMKITIDSKAVSQATRDNIQAVLETCRNGCRRGNQ